MSFVWLIILLIHGFVTGWDILPLYWWLLAPFVLQDVFDVKKGK